MLADEPRVGKTGAAIIAADLVVAERILVITTKSGRAVWQRGFDDWQAFPREILVVDSRATRLRRLRELRYEPIAAIISWRALTNPQIMAELLPQSWGVILPDEDHYAKNFDSQRTQALYGRLDDGGLQLIEAASLKPRAARLWQLTGSPYPHDLSDGYTRLRACAPHLLAGSPERGWPDVTKRETFLHRYCIVRMKRVTPFRWIPVVVAGTNEAEFRARFNGFLLRRTQKDVGIQPPRYDFLPLSVSDRETREVNASPEADRMLVALQHMGAGRATDDDRKVLDQHLGPLQRLAGEIKARAVVEAVTEEFECGLDRIVLAYWHRNVGDILEAGLSQFGLIRIDGSTSEKARATAEGDFKRPGGARITLAQIAAAGEAIDLSASAELWFVEQVISPKGMDQMSKRITNKTQTRTPLVRVCTLIGSIDEAISASLMRLWTSINKGTQA